MLILTRSPNENIVITNEDGERFEVHIISIQGKQVRLGISAPIGVSVHRNEIQARIEQTEVH